LRRTPSRKSWRLQLQQPMPLSLEAPTPFSGDPLGALAARHSVRCARRANGALWVTSFQFAWTTDTTQRLVGKTVSCNVRIAKDIAHCHATEVWRFVKSGVRKGPTDLVNNTRTTVRAPPPRRWTYRWNCRRHRQHRDREDGESLVRWQLKPGHEDVMRVEIGQT
jgi:hypothetical protein